MDRIHLDLGRPINYTKVIVSTIRDTDRIEEWRQKMADYQNNIELR